MAGTVTLNMNTLVKRHCMVPDFIEVEFWWASHYQNGLNYQS